MAGLFILLILIVWVYVAYKLTKLILFSKKRGGVKNLLSIVVFLLIVLVPVSDDFASGFQFRELCRQSDNLVFDETKIKGATVQLKNLPSKLLQKIVPIRVQVWDWVDPKSGQTIIKYKDYSATGGWLSRAIGFPQGSPPYTYNGSCGSKRGRELFAEFSVIKNVANYYGE
tara:strand:- start:98 stop:610 length:513 start_codon:yes stop_codon:yes gene_type:complete